MFAFLNRGRPAYLPVNNRSGPPRDVKVQIPYLVQNGSPTFLSLALAAILGMLLGYNVLSRGPTDYYNPFSGPNGVSNSPPIVPDLLKPLPYIPPPTPTHKKDDGELSVEQLREIVAPTKGYYVRDWSLHLGWNNVRVTIMPSSRLS